ncbi:MAG: YadA-like family protein [Alphaproteobacteria bacterium]|nr:YadA-like family protein [Alphaproteobacteria bacterium]
MKKHVFLTSLVAIAMSTPAFAATDVTFGGKYTQTDGTQANIADALAGVPYEYIKSDGTTATVADHNTAPSVTDFTYTDREGNPADLSTGVPAQSDFWADTTADGVNVKTTQTIVSGATASRDNYTYLNGAGEEVVLGAEEQDMVKTHTLSDYAGGAEVTITNGAADTTFDGSLYEFDFEGQTFKLSSDGLAYTLNGVPQEEPTETSSKALFDLLTEVRGAYTADKAAVDAAVADTGAKWTTEQANFAAAETVFNNDSAKITELDGFFATVGTATNAYDAAQAKQQAAKDAYAANDTLLNDAKAVYDAPILETITDGANDAIDSALAQGGAIRSELDVNATAIADNKTVIETNATNIATNATNIAANKTAIETNASNIATNATNIAANKTAIETNASNIATNATNIAANKTAIETNATNIAANKTAIEVNATNIAANKTAIESEVARATAAEAELDGKIALNTAAIEEEVANRIAGDEMTLSAAKAYADAKNTMSLKSAYDYTDKKVDALEEELSAGIASAAAMSSVAVSNVAKGEVSVGGGYGYYNSQSAVALGAAMGLTDNWSVNAAAGLSDSNVTFRAGTNYKFKLF